MNTSVLKQVPKGEDLTRAVLEMEEHDLRMHDKAQIQRGLDASNDPNAPRTAHANNIRIISARKATQYEKTIYKQE